MSEDHKTPAKRRRRGSPHQVFRRHLRVLIRYYKYQWDDARIAEAYGYSPSAVSQICRATGSYREHLPAGRRLAPHIEWLKEKYTRPYWVPSIEYLMKQPERPESQTRKKRKGHPGCPLPVSFSGSVMRLMRQPGFKKLILRRTRRATKE